MPIDYDGARFDLVFIIHVLFINAAFITAIRYLYLTSIQNVNKLIIYLFYNKYFVLCIKVIAGDSEFVFCKTLLRTFSISDYYKKVS